MANRPDSPFDAADQCVKCGLCTPHCPSYAQTGHEGDSPRGRISLMDALAKGQIGASDRLEHHLDGCLGCRACEPVCPAQVPYSVILDAGRAQLMQLRPRPFRRLWITGLTHPIGQWLARFLIRLWFRSPGLAWRQRRLSAGRWARWHSLLRLAAAPMPIAPVPMANTDRRAAALRLATCVGASLSPASDAAAAVVLQSLGVPSTPLRGVCCGALARHAGLSERANAQRADLQRRVGSRTLVSLASGCGAELCGAGQTVDVLTMLRRHWRDDLPLQPLSLHVAIHRPCSHRNVLRSDGDIDWLLDRLPGLTVTELPDNARCCGAAGHHLLSHPDLADRHLDAKLAALHPGAPDVIVSSNIGCAVHLAAGLERHHLGAVRVMHPVGLLAEALAPQ